MDTEEFEPRMLSLRRPSPAYMQWLMWICITGISVGILVGVAGRVATSCVIIAVATCGIVIIRFLRSQKRRKIELIVPLAIVLLLIVVALTLPHAR
jgi:uncharacterized membrane protein YjjP (DUF1212 family)